MTDRIRINYTAAIYYLLLFLVFLFSFLTFSYRFYPLLNADMAINILMTPGYHMPQDLYAWGQDRGGTLIPLLSHIFIRLVPINPASAVSVVHYLILALGFLASAQLFRAMATRFLLALMWFFPPWHFTDFVLFPFGTQFSLFMIGIWLLGRQETTRNLVVKQLLQAASCIIMILSIWVSEFGILMVLLFGLTLLYRTFSHKNSITLKGMIFPLLNVILWLAAGTAFILYAKSKAVRIDVYSDQPFNNIGEVIMSATIIIKSLRDVFAFSSENFMESIYAWLLLFGIPAITMAAIFRNKGGYQRINKKWYWFFMLNGILTILALVLSHWVFLNGVGRRYFVLVYISFAMATLFLLETFELRKLKILQIAFVIVILTGMVSSFYTFYYPKHVPSRIRVLAEFQSLGHIGLVAEYWNAYLSASPDPYRIKATPHDKDYVRNFHLVEEVFAQPRIYVIKDMWMDSFPDTLHQFGRTLVRKGEQFYIGQCWVNEYEIKHP